MNVSDYYHTAATFALVIGATWALRTKLADIEVAIRGHIEHDAEVHRAQDAKIVRLEKRRVR